MRYCTFCQIKTCVFRIAVLGLYLFFALSLLSFNPADMYNTNVWPNVEPTNWCRAPGAKLASTVYALLGYGAYFSIFLLGYHCLRVLFGFHAKLFTLRFTGFCLLQIAVCGLTTLVLCNNFSVPNPIYGDLGFSERFSTNLIYGHGGIVGVSWASFFSCKGPFLGYVCLSMLGFLGLFLYSDFLVPYVLRQCAQFLPRKALRRVLPWIYWNLRLRTGWNRAYHPRILRNVFQKKSIFLEPGVVLNDVDGDLPRVGETDQAEAGTAEETAKTASKDGESKDGTDSQNLLADIADPDITPPPESMHAGNAARKKRLSEECLDGYEIDEDTFLPRKIRNSETAAKEKPRSISIHHPETSPVDLTGGNPALQAAGNAESAASKLPTASTAQPVMENGIELREHQDVAEPEYIFPPMDLLSPAEVVDYSEFEVEARERAQYLESIIQEFGFKVSVREIQLGPTITQYQVEPEQGLRVAKIASLADDLAVKLGVSNVRIVFPLLGKQNLIGIEIPNVKKQLVRLREVMEQLDGTYEKMSIPMFLGKDVAGKPLMSDLAALPHLLIAGRTGTGKSVCLNSIITSIIMTRSPKDVRMLMIDPKMVEMSQYQTIPHLMHPVVTDMKKAEAILAWAVEKMEDRYRWFARAGVRHIKDFNRMDRDVRIKRVKPKAGETMPESMPFIVIVVDEMADLMMTAPKDVESHIIRLAQKSRAVGIHLILATQKPIVTVITSLIKSNLPARIAFQVSSKTDSRVVLDENGADRLLGHGDMLFLLPGTSTLIRAQGTYLSDDEIYRVVESISTEEPQFENDIVQHLSGGGSGKMEEWAAKDELYTSAIEIIVNERRGSISLLQRMLGIGYGRAARLIDFMEEDKIVGPFCGYTKPREVLLTKDAWNAMKAEFDQIQEKEIQTQAAMAKAEREAQALEEMENWAGKGTRRRLAESEEELSEEEFDEDSYEDSDEDFEDESYENARNRNYFDEDSEEDWEDDPDADLDENLADDSDGEMDDSGEGSRQNEDSELPWDEEENDWDSERKWSSAEPLYPLPSRPIERSRGKSRRRMTPDYEKIRSRTPDTETAEEENESQTAEEDTLRTAESQDVLSRIEPNQPEPFLHEGKKNFRKIQ